MKILFSFFFQRAFTIAKLIFALLEQMNFVRTLKLTTIGVKMSRQNHPKIQYE